MKYGASDAIQDGYVQLGASGSGTNVQLDPDDPTGDRGFRSFLQVEGVSPADLSNASNFAF
ncbi:MAG: hypothetical protein BRC59_07950 [Cyanobacteria bacterium SW_4_48_29]|nr:MAG: hypothetical protein BRC59_07950 [Cyanobacteria bacterium SW_4_48_29]